MKYIIIVLLLFISNRTIAQRDYDGRIKEREILTPLPSDKPKINGPKLYGARANREFVYRIPCQGVRPIEFSIDGLPEGMSVSTDGIITGTTPAADGDYNMFITAKNRKGEVSRPFKLVVGDKLALTPPTGWNTWGGYMLLVSDSLMRSVADYFVDKGLADVGYQYLGIDDCWMRISPKRYKSRSAKKVAQQEGFDYTGIIGEPRDKEGNILPNDKFPDMKLLSDYIHSKGLKVGIYSSPGDVTCVGWTASRDYEAQDADQYAKWGIDLLKYDMCSGYQAYNAIKERYPDYKQSNLWRNMASAINGQKRDILFNLCQYGAEQPWEWAPSLGIQTWRTTHDLNKRIETFFDSALTIATKLREYNKPGQWSDPDFLYIHYVREKVAMSSGSSEVRLNTNERYQYVTLWSMICAPFFFSSNIEMLDEFSLRILSNPHLMNINQDELGITAKVIRNENDEVVMVKELADGRKAVALFNRNSEQERDVTINWGEIDECCEMEVYDAWRCRDLGDYRGGITTTLSPNGVALYIIK